MCCSTAAADPAMVAVRVSLDCFASLMLRPISPGEGQRLHPPQASSRGGLERMGLSSGLGQ